MQHNDELFMHGRIFLENNNKKGTQTLKSRLKDLNAYLNDNNHTKSTNNFLLQNPTATWVSTDPPRKKQKFSSWLTATEFEEKVSQPTKNYVPL